MAESQNVHLIHRVNYSSICALELLHLSSVIKCTFSELCGELVYGLLLIGSFKNSKLFTREEGSEFF